VVEQCARVLGLCRQDRRRLRVDGDDRIAHEQGARRLMEEGGVLVDGLARGLGRDDGELELAAEEAVAARGELLHLAWEAEPRRR